MINVLNLEKSQRTLYTQSRQGWIGFDCSRNTYWLYEIEKSSFVQGVSYSIPTI